VSTMISTPPPPTLASPGGETRIRIPNASWQLYRSFVEHLPESTPIRVAFDGRSMEIMVKGPFHDHFADLIDELIKAIASEHGISIKPMGETTWIRPEVARGIEADRCYYLDPTKIETVQANLARRSNDVADYPNPDLAVEVDISPPQADRMAIYAALAVAEVWTFDGQELTIHRLTVEGGYQPVEQRGSLPVR
jgi:Uma2 family endonuclease